MPQGADIPDGRIENKTLSTQKAEKSSVINNQYSCASNEQPTMVFENALMRRRPHLHSSISITGQISLRHSIAPGRKKLLIKLGKVY